MNKKRKKLFLRLCLASFILLNAVAALHAYNFTHFNTSSTAKTNDSMHLTALEKAEVLLTGVDLPRPRNKCLPSRPYQEIILNDDVHTACWYMTPGENVPAKGCVIVFHGYGGEKSSMLDKANAFLAFGYNTLLVDFMGSGKSAGNRTSIGYWEAGQVKSCYDYLSVQGEKNIFLFGTSMGASAILKSMHDYQLQPAGIILECPFGSLYDTACARFRSLGLPAFPMAGLLVFWGGIENGFWGFSYCPEDYAASVNCPTLLLYGEQDEKVSPAETDTIFSRLHGEKTLVTFSPAGHENYLRRHKFSWLKSVYQFLGNKDTGT